jgi:hypothetical protein
MDCFLFKCMKTIYYVRSIGKERISSHDDLFEDKEEAKAFLKDPEPGVTKLLMPWNVWEKGEYSSEARKRADALAKLTEEEKQLLGLA